MRLHNFEKIELQSQMLFLYGGHENTIPKVMRLKNTRLCNENLKHLWGENPRTGQSESIRRLRLKRLFVFYETT